MVKGRFWGMSTLSTLGIHKCMMSRLRSCYHPKTNRGTLSCFAQTPWLPGLQGWLRARPLKAGKAGIPQSCSEAGDKVTTSITGRRSRCGKGHKRTLDSREGTEVTLPLTGFPPLSLSSRDLMTFQDAQRPETRPLLLAIFPKVGVVATHLGSTLGVSASGCGYKGWRHIHGQ